MRCFLYISSNIAEKIKTTAKLKNIQIKDMLAECELSKNTLSSMQAGGSIPKSDNLAKIADYLDVSVDFLLGRTKTSILIKDIPDKIIDIITEQYSKNPKEFISDEFIKAPNKTMKNQVYSFFDYCYKDYMNIYDEAYNYAKENEINMLEATRVGSKKEYLKMINIHDDFIPRMITGKYYTLTQDNYNMFRRVYRLYCKAYSEYVKKLLDNVE